MTRAVKTARWAIRGSLVALRRFSPSDITSEYLGWLNDPNISAYLRKQHWTKREATKWVAAQLGNPGVAFFMVCRAGGDEPIGTLKLEQEIGLIHDKEGSRGGEIAVLGILIAKPGLGYGAEAIRLGVTWARREWQVVGVRAGIHTANARSIAAFAGAGFDFEPETVWATCR